MTLPCHPAGGSPPGPARRMLPVIGNVGRPGFAGGRPVPGLGPAGWSGHGFGGAAAEGVTRDARVYVGTGRPVRRTGHGLPLDVG
jgi:hypothetical protein